MATVLVDTNIVIEAVRTHSWNALAGHYEIETVQTCRDELLAGDPLRPGYVEVDEKDLSSKLKAARTVSDVERAALLIACPEAAGLDDGERDLFAHALSRNDEWVLVCADRAAVRIACALGWQDRIVSLEKLANDAGANPKPKLKDHFTERWLGIVRAQFALGS